MIKFYIKELIKEYIKDNKGESAVEPLTIVLRASDSSIIGKVVVETITMNLFGYERSKNEKDTEWEVNKKRITQEEFNKVCELTNNIEIL